ncbi:MAG: HEAT repeat domain-containing protein [Planctomycetota bacterium]
MSSETQQNQDSKPRDEFALEAPAAEAPSPVEAPQNESWFVPFVVIPLAIALTILGIVFLGNFLLGNTGARSFDDLLQDIRGGGSNTKKQAAFHLARNLKEEDDEYQKTVRASGGPAAGQLAPPRLKRPRRDLAKMEAAFDATKGELETRLFLAAALGLAGDDDTIDFLAKYISDVQEGDSDGQFRVTILLAMARIGSERAVPYFEEELKRASQGDQDPGIMNALAAGLGNINSKAATQKLVEILNISKNRGPGPAGASRTKTTWKVVRWTAALNLAKRRDVDGESAKLAIPVLLESIDDVHQDAFRPDNEKTFHGSGGSGGFMPAGVTSQGDGFREQAAQQLIEAIVFLDIKEAVALLQKIAAADPNLRIRSFALEAVKRLVPAASKNPAK